MVAFYDDIFCGLRESKASNFRTNSDWLIWLAARGGSLGSIRCGPRVGRVRASPAALGRVRGACDVTAGRTRGDRWAQCAAPIIWLWRFLLDLVPGRLAGNWLRQVCTQRSPSGGWVSMQLSQEKCATSRLFLFEIRNFMKENIV